MQYLPLKITLWAFPQNLVAWLKCKWFFKLTICIKNQRAIVYENENTPKKYEHGIFTRKNVSWLLHNFCTIIFAAKENDWIRCLRQNNHIFMWFCIFQKMVISNGKFEISKRKPIWRRDFAAKTYFFILALSKFKCNSQTLKNALDFSLLQNLKPNFWKFVFKKNYTGLLILFRSFAYW